MPFAAHTALDMILTVKNTKSRRFYNNLTFLGSVITVFTFLIKDLVGDDRYL